MNGVMDIVNKKYSKKSIPDIATGDMVRVSQKIQEGGKTRLQVFEGMVIARSGGDGVSASITVRKIASGVGVEKKYLLNSPTIESIKIVRSSKVRRKKIYFLRALTGKASKIKEKQRKILESIGDDGSEQPEPELTEAPVEEAKEESPMEATEVVEAVEVPIEEATAEQKATEAEIAETVIEKVESAVDAQQEGANNDEAKG